MHFITVIIENQHRLLPKKMKKIDFIKLINQNKFLSTVLFANGKDIIQENWRQAETVSPYIEETTI